MIVGGFFFSLEKSLLIRCSLFASKMIHARMSFIKVGPAAKSGRIAWFHRFASSTRFLLLLKSGVDVESKSTRLDFS